MGANYRMPQVTTAPLPTCIYNLRHSAWLVSPELFMGGRPQAASLVQGLRPRNAPLQNHRPPTVCAHSSSVSSQLCLPPHLPPQPTDHRPLISGVPLTTGVPLKTNN